MPVNLLALCKTGNAFVVKRVKVTAAVQAQLEGVFIQQEQTFLNGINEEVVFDGGWSPEPNELLYAPITAEATAVLQAAQGNIVAMPEVNAAAFADEGIRALAVLVQRPAGPRLLLQEFSARQLLEQVQPRTRRRYLQPSNPTCIQYWRVASRHGRQRAHQVSPVQPH